jgi:NADH:ubiquinone oxidoreductase subunit
MASVSEPFSFIARLSHIGTQMFTSFCGIKMGSDRFGNVYYREKNPPKDRREKRWIMYKGRPEASQITPEWHGWLHYTMDQPLPEEGEFHKPWMKPHQPNLTFSDQAYLPPGHAARGGRRDKATGDYEAWSPKDIANK